MNVLLERKNSLLAELRTLVDTATTEKRDLTDDEKKA